MYSGVVLKHTVCLKKNKKNHSWGSSSKKGSSALKHTVFWGLPLWCSLKNRYLKNRSSLVFFLLSCFERKNRSSLVFFLFLKKKNPKRRTALVFAAALRFQKNKKNNTWFFCVFIWNEPFLWCCSKTHRLLAHGVFQKNPRKQTTVLVLLFKNSKKWCCFLWTKEDTVCFNGSFQKKYFLKNGSSCSKNGSFKKSENWFSLNERSNSPSFFFETQCVSEEARVLKHTVWDTKHLFSSSFSLKNHGSFLKNRSTEEARVLLLRHKAFVFLGFVYLKNPKNGSSSFVQEEARRSVVLLLLKHRRTPKKKKNRSVVLLVPLLKHRRTPKKKKNRFFLLFFLFFFWNTEEPQKRRRTAVLCGFFRFLALKKKNKTLEEWFVPTLPFWCFFRFLALKERTARRMVLLVLLEPCCFFLFWCSLFLSEQEEPFFKKRSWRMVLLVPRVQEQEDNFLFLIVLLLIVLLLNVFQIKNTRCSAVW